MGKTIGIVSLKGGVGKTTVVTALGGAFALLGKKILVVDANLSNPNLGLHLNFVDPEKTLHDVLNRTSRTREAIQKYDGLDIDVLPAAIFNNLQIEPLKLKDHLKNVKKDYDVILIDSSPALDDETLGAMLASDEILVVTTADHVAVSTSIKAAKLAKNRGVPISGLILNKSHGKDFEISLKDLEKTLDIPVLAVIPHDTHIAEALAEMRPSTEHKPNSKGSKEFMQLAATLVGEKYKQSNFLNFFGFLAPTKQEVNREMFYHNVFK